MDVAMLPWLDLDNRSGVRTTFTVVAELLDFPKYDRTSAFDVRAVD